MAAVTDLGARIELAGLKKQDAKLDARIDELAQQIADLQIYTAKLESLLSQGMNYNQK